MMRTGVTLMKAVEELNDNNSIILSDESFDSGFCVECTGELIFDNSRGEIICSNCGLVTESKMIDHSQEWRAYSNDEYNNRSRTGDPLDVLSDDIKLRSTFSSHHKTSMNWQNSHKYLMKITYYEEHNILNDMNSHNYNDIFF